MNTNSNILADTLFSMGRPISGMDLDVLHQKFIEIRKLKKEKNAVVLSHYYMIPELQLKEQQGGIADYIGDSLGLSIEATRTTADYIIFCGVKFMAETAKILNPEKKVLIPDENAGCSLASSIKGEDVVNLKKKYPNVPIIAYINTYAETKAECDICCTSRNAMAIANSFPEKQLIFIPDVFMGKNLRSRIIAETGKKLILWNGKCEVHEQFTASMITKLQMENPDAETLVHWEVPEETAQASLHNMRGIIGSTNDLIHYVSRSKASKFILGSECDLGATLKGMYRDKQFLTPCIYCPYMKKINVDNVLRSLSSIGKEDEKLFEVDVQEPTLSKAYIPIKKMLNFL